MALSKIPDRQEATPVRCVLRESPSKHGPYGAKEVGEPPVVPPPAAIALGWIAERVHARRLRPRLEPSG